MGYLFPKFQQFPHSPRIYVQTILIAIKGFINKTIKFYIYIKKTHQHFGVLHMIKDVWISLIRVSYDGQCSYLRLVKTKLTTPKPFTEYCGIINLNLRVPIFVDCVVFLIR